MDGWMGPLNAIFGVSELKLLPACCSRAIIITNLKINATTATTIDRASDNFTHLPSVLPCCPGRSVVVDDSFSISMLLLLPPSHVARFSTSSAAELVQECEERVGDRFRRRNDKSDTLSALPLFPRRDGLDSRVDLRRSAAKWGRCYLRCNLVIQNRVFLTLV